MNKISVPFDPAAKQTEHPVRARDWIKVLSAYRDPSTARSFFELGVTIGPFLALWAMACRQVVI